MNRTQFISFMENPDNLSGNDSVLLTELIKNFPYFQTAQSLFAKSLHNQHSIHYNNQLKIAAAYATDRKVLHRLITKQTAADVETAVALETISAEKQLEEAVIKIVKEEVEEHNIEVVIDNTITSETVNLHEVSEENEVIIIEEKTTTPSPEIAASNENNIIDLPDEITEEKKNESLSEFETEYLSNAANAIFELEINDSTSETIDIIEKEAHNTAESDFVLNTLPLQETQPLLAKKNFDSGETHSFNDWLKNLTTEVSSEEEPEPSEKAIKKNRPNDLIDKFLREEPKISRPKAEFYNPVNMAKQSVADDITFVSETLAKIYVLQGNYSKALHAYENLRLKYPEKRLYFAAQIKNIRKLINQQQKQ
jgi:hypothetical protein